jgi:hypothetical protein
MQLRYQNKEITTKNNKKNNNMKPNSKQGKKWNSKNLLFVKNWILMSSDLHTILSGHECFFHPCNANPSPSFIQRHLLFQLGKITSQIFHNQQ